jgi:predicted membrane chloride channel (bestrophin family)
MFGSAKSLMRFLRTYEPKLNTENLADLLTAYAISIKQRLRGDNTSKQIEPYLTEKELAFAEKTNNKPTAIKYVTCIV